MAEPWIEHLDDTPVHSRLRFTPRWGWGVLGWALFVLLGVIFALAVPREGRWMLAVLGLVLGSELVWFIRGWEEVSLTPERLRLRRQHILTRSLLDAPLPSVEGFEARPRRRLQEPSTLRLRGDNRELSVVLGGGQRAHFGKGVKEPSAVAALLNDRLHRLKRGSAGAAEPAALADVTHELPC